MVKSQPMDALDTGKLQTFVTIAHEGSFTKAAARLKLTQPTVSQQLATLERDIGARLILRQPRKIKLTEAGEGLLNYAERILALCEEAVQTTRRSARRARRTLRLGVGHTLAIYLLPNLLRRIRQRRPDLEIRIQAGNTADLLTATVDGQVELSLVGSPASHPQLTITPFMTDDLVVIVATNDPWVERPFVTIDDLRQRTLLTREICSALHASVRELLGPDFLDSSQVITLGETEAIKRSVEANLGPALIQKIAVKRELKQGILQTVPLKGVSTVRTYNVACRHNRPLSPMGEILFELLTHPEDGTPLEKHASH